MFKIAKSQKCTLLHTISLIIYLNTVSSYRFNGGNDNVMLEYMVMLTLLSNIIHLHFSEAFLHETSHRAKESIP